MINVKEVLKTDKVLNSMNTPQSTEEPLQYLQNSNIEKMSLRTERGYTFCKKEDIIYLKAEKRHTWIHLKDGAVFQVKYHGISEFEKCLYDRIKFKRIHKSYIINTTYLKEYNKERERVQMDTPANIKSWLPVGTCYIDAFVKYIKGLQPY